MALLCRVGSQARPLFYTIKAVKSPAREGDEGDPLFRREGFLKDIRYAIRNLTPSPGFTIERVDIGSGFVGASGAFQIFTVDRI
jgi:hypothetical protein